VSTKIPYKGTGKEYIGDDITEISASVKRALQTCCQQLRTHLLKRNALRDQKDRRSKLTKYIPDVTRALYALLDGMRKRHQEEPSAATQSPRKRPRTDPSLVKDMSDRLDQGGVTAALIKQSLEEAVNVQNSFVELEQAQKSKEKGGVPLFLVPLFDFDDASHDIDHPLFTFRPIKPVAP
jgi:DNA topoisomerase-6 subunit B